MWWLALPSRFFFFFLSFFLLLRIVFTILIWYYLVLLLFRVIVIFTEIAYNSTPMRHCFAIFVIGLYCCTGIFCCCFGIPGMRRSHVKGRIGDKLLFCKKDKTAMSKNEGTDVTREVFVTSRRVKLDWHVRRHFQPIRQSKVRKNTKRHPNAAGLFCVFVYFCFRCSGIKSHSHVVCLPFTADLQRCCCCFVVSATSF